jgi:RNA polymerase sigma factor (sigma-70 family)
MQNNEDTEGRLLRRLQLGSKGAVDELIDRYGRLVEHICRRLIDDPDDRADAYQVVFIKAWQNIAGFRRQSSLATWLGRIAYNQCMNIRQVANKKKQVEANSLEHLATPEPSPLTRVMLSDIELQLDSKITKLPPVPRMVLSLYHYQGMSYADIAEVTGLSMNTVKSHLFRARNELKKILAKEFAEQIYV